MDGSVLWVPTVECLLEMNMLRKARYEKFLRLPEGFELAADSRTLSFNGGLGNGQVRGRFLNLIPDRSSVQKLVTEENTVDTETY